MNYNKLITKDCRQRPKPVELFVEKEPEIVYLTRDGFPIGVIFGYENAKQFLQTIKKEREKLL